MFFPVSFTVVRELQETNITTEFETAWETESDWLTEARMKTVEHCSCQPPGCSSMCYGWMLYAHAVSVVDCGTVGSIPEAALLLISVVVIQIWICWMSSMTWDIGAWRNQLRYLFWLNPFVSLIRGWLTWMEIRQTWDETCIFLCSRDSEIYGCPQGVKLAPIICTWKGGGPTASIHSDHFKKG